MRKHFLSILAALWLTACASDAALDPKTSSTLATYQTTCLKRGFAIDTPEHTECVAALYDNDQRRLARLRQIVAPATPQGDDRANTDTATGRGSDR